MNFERLASFRPLAGFALCALAAAAAAQPQIPQPRTTESDGPWTYTTFEQGTQIRVSVVAAGLAHPWSIAFLPGTAGAGNPMGDALITEREGRIRLLKGGSLVAEPAANLKDVFELDQVFDIALHPDFERNRLVYFTYSKTAAPPEGERYFATTALARGRLDGERLTDIEDVFVAYAWHTNFGGDASPIAFAPDGHIFMSVSHRRVPEPPQSLGSHIGKVLRLTDTGEPAPGNPFSGAEGALPEIYSYGHRTVMDLTFRPETGELWELENGPNGGDEINIITAGENYGWPIVTYGRDYDGSRAAPQPWQEGMQQPELFWVPSITAASLLFYTGDRFPAWRGNLFVTAMTEGRLPRTGHVQRIVFNENGEVRRERLLTDLGLRMRHIAAGPDGLLYLLTDQDEGALLRIEPVDAAETTSSVRSTPAGTAAGRIAPPNQAPALFAEHDCATCHQLERRNIGPAYLEIAQRYEATDDVVAQLAARIITGSVGQWGEAPMTAHPGIDTDTAKDIVRTILALDSAGER
jgi:glucose/arabinose dehydrogenase/cytochrome c551/c552